jgi:TnpA family transposase
MASSSDGQFFQAAGYSRAAADLNAHYGHKPGFKAYTHLSDRYGPCYTKLIAATASEALHVLDALFYHQVRLPHGDTIPMAAAIPTMSSPYARWSGCSLRPVSRT